MLEPIPFAGMIEIPNELTDEEIAEIAKEYFVSQYIPYDFVRALLKKAQEK
jgi:hypothetical protein